MKAISSISIWTVASLLAVMAALGAPTAARVKTANGVIEGVNRPSGIRIFRGIPFAAQPVGELRWKAPQPVKNWEGVRQAVEFSASCMQRPVFGDMEFRAKGMSEDCLYLNVWTRAKSAGEKRPVIVWIYGGGFQSGGSAVPIYDGEAMAKKGIVFVSINYRVGVFGFFAHPEDSLGDLPCREHGLLHFLAMDQTAFWCNAALQC